MDNEKKLADKFFKQLPHIYEEMAENYKFIMLFTINIYHDLSIFSFPAYATRMYNLVLSEYMLDLTHCTDTIDLYSKVVPTKYINSCIII